MNIRRIRTVRNRRKVSDVSTKPTHKFHENTFFIVRPFIIVKIKKDFLQFFLGYLVPDEFHVGFQKSKLRACHSQFVDKLPSNAIRGIINLNVNQPLQFIEVFYHEIIIKHDDFIIFLYFWIDERIKARIIWRVDFNWDFHTVPQFNELFHAHVLVCKHFPLMMHAVYYQIHSSDPLQIPDSMKTPN